VEGDDMNKRHKLNILLVVLLIIFLACSNSDSNSNNEFSIFNDGVEETLDAIITELSPSETEEATDRSEAASTPIPTKEVAQPTQPPVIPESVTHDCVSDNTQRDLAVLVRGIDGDTIEVVVNGETKWILSRYFDLKWPENRKENH
jgi:nitrate reductase cytochrome c-type subunit